MSVWTNFRKRFLPGQRVKPRATIQLTLEELGARLAPGALLGGAGQTSLSFLGQPTASFNPPARVVAPAQIITAASVPAAPATTTPAPVASNLQAPTGLSLDNFSASALDGGSAFADSASAPAPVAAPTIASSPDAGNSGTAPSPAVETASPMSSSTPQNISAPSGSAGSPLDLVPTAPPTVTLQVPDFAGRGTPQVSVTVAEPAGVPGSSTMQVHVDVDVRHDGKFNDPGDSNFGLATINGSGTISLTKPLASGTYSVRAWAVGSNGVVGFSAKESMVVDASAGVVGSEALVDVAEGLRYGTNTPIGGGGGENGGGIGAAALAKDYSFLEFDAQGRVLVDVHSGLTQDVSALQNELQSNLGFKTTGVYPSQNMVTGWLPVNQILNLPNIAKFAYVTPVYKPIANVGSYPTDADPVIHSDTFRAANNVNGAGVKVGVISTSINQVGGGIAASVATGDLPANVQVLEDELDGMGTDEGRAMSEIIHHVAPGASLAFHSGFNGQQDFATGIQQLVNAGAKVITDDVGYFDEPVFNDGIIAQAAESAVNQGVFYTSAAGNNADHAYAAPYRGITATVGGVTGQFQDITGTGTALQTFTLPVGDTTLISFTWDAAYLEGGGTGNFVVPNSFIAQVTAANGAALSTPQTFTTTPNEANVIVQFTNDGSFGTNNFAFSFNLASGPAPTQVYWQSEDDGGPGNPQALDEGAYTIVGHQHGTGVVSTGAVDYATPNTVEPFSALGGAVPIFFDNSGVRLAAPEIRNVPIVAAPDGVQTSFFGQQDNTGRFLFFGTSAATPHVAAAAALLMQQAPTATTAEVTQYLEANALNLNDPTHAGAGLIQLTVPLVVPPPPPPVPPVVTTENELNRTSDTAEDFGSLDVNAPVAITGQDITRLATGQNDYDWFRFTPAQAGTFAATESTLTGGNLELHLFTLFGNTLLELASSVAPGVASQTLTAAVAAGQPILVEVKGENSSFGVQDAGTYQLIVSLT